MNDANKFNDAIKKSTIEIHEKQVGWINDMMSPEFIDCNFDEKWVEFRYVAKEWESNRVGQLHGGLIATMFDFAMGVLTRATHGIDFVPTVELSITFVRPVDVNESVIVKSKIEHAGKKITHLSAEIWKEISGKKVAMAKGIFYNENTSKIL